MAKIRVAFNGMGRIGKNVMRVITSEYNDQIEIVAGNDLVPASEIAARAWDQPVALAHRQPDAARHCAVGTVEPDVGGAPVGRHDVGHVAGQVCHSGVALVPIGG